MRAASNGRKGHPIGAAWEDRRVDVAAIVERLWPGVPARVDVLGGGITNYNFRVRFDDGGDFVLRVSGRDTALLGIDREAEYGASLVAAAVGVGPAVVTFVQPECCLVTRFIEGAIIPIESMREPATVRRVAESLRAVHTGPPIPGRFDSFRVVEDYSAAARKRGVVIPADFDSALETAGRIEQARGATPERPCHNDLLNANFIDDGKRVRIVDWEYAGMGDVFFDLANFAVNHELEEPGECELLAAYFGRESDRDRDALVLMRFMSDFREAMWGVLQQGISDVDFDFVAYAEEHFARAATTAATDRFLAALAG